MDMKTTRKELGHVIENVHITVLELICCSFFSISCIGVICRIMFGSYVVTYLVER